MAPFAHLPKTFILGSSYISMLKCAEDYRHIMAKMNCLAKTLDEAEVVVVHASIGEAADMLRYMPGLKSRYLVGYLVWEADRLPESARPVVCQFDEIWTPTLYSARSLLKMHQRVRLLPHVVRPPIVPSKEAVAALDNLLGPPPQCTLLQIGQWADKRKNFTEAQEAFFVASIARPGLTLLQKPVESISSTDQHNLGARFLGPVVEIYGLFNEDLMAALYARGDYVLSTHHGEGWGLTMSEGMALGTVAIASRYSGNLAYMDHESSLLIEGYEAPIHKNDETKNFKAPMRWHHNFDGFTEAAICRAYDLVGTDAYRRMAKKGIQNVQRYSSNTIALLMRPLLQDIAKPRSQPSMKAGRAIFDSHRG